MKSMPNPLPTDPEALRRLVLDQQQALAANEAEIAGKDTEIARHLSDLGVHRQLLSDRDKEIEALKESIALLYAKRYSYSSEKRNGLQGDLFDEAELETEIHALEAQLAQQQAASQHGAKTPKTSPAAEPAEKPHRKPLPAHLRRISVDIDVSPTDKQAMGDDWVFIGWETSEQLAVQEREYFVKELRRAKYVKKTAPDDDQAAAPLKVAPPVPVILPKSMVDASVLAKIITGKFIDALSFYREHKVLAREGIDIGYSTLCSYPIQLTERLAPLRALFYNYAAESSLWHLDETVLQVLGEPDRADRTNSYLWAIRAGPPEAPVILFHYDPRRSYLALDEWLGPVAARFNGVIVSDEHKPYQRFADSYPGIAVRGGCWSHCRRKFVDAVKGRRHQSDAHRVLAMIATLYELDGKFVGMNDEQRLEGRRRVVQPHLQKLHDFVTTLQPAYPDKGLMRKAITYLLNSWPSLTAFVDHPCLPLDNNPIENAIRPFTVGRRNWLFSGSPAGAAASAFMYSLVESAKANRWEPKAYLQALFEQYPFAKTDEERRALLPMFLKNA